MKELVFQLYTPFLSAEDLAFHRLQLGRNEALAVGDGLLAHIIGRHLVQIRFGHLDIVTEHRIEAHLERLDSSARNFILLQFRDPIFPPAHRRAQFVQGRIETIADQPALLYRQRRLFHDGPRDQFHQLGQLAELRFQLLQQGRKAFHRAADLIRSR